MTENAEIIRDLKEKIKHLQEENEKLRQVKSRILQRLNGLKNPVLPEKGKKNILITSALPYVNNVPHLGNIIGAVLSADVYARYCRQRGYNTLYICGTDEYGTATETKALQENTTPQKICDKYFKIHSSVYEWFNISFDLFGRTSTEYQTKIAQGIFKDIQSRGLTSVKTTSQLYSEKIGKFLADRFVLGTCPHCEYEDARGDQCDMCGKLLKPTELVNPICAVSKTTPILKDSTHLYLNLPKIEPELAEWAKKSMKEGTWSSVAKAITESWLTEGLLERCITRDLQWGTPVPDPEFKDKVFYVWFDAPIGYISITANYTSEWKKWWMDPENVDYVQFMGKDNVPFHSIIFPSTLLATGKNWTKVNSLSSTAYLNYEDTKFSKSRGIGVFGDEAMETGIPSYSWRYYLLRTRPTSSDSTFEWSGFAQKINTELLANLGNFTNRGLSLCASLYDRVVPELGEITQAELDLHKEVNSYVSKYHQSMSEIRLKEGLATAMHVSKEGNRYLQSEQPWVLKKTDKARCRTVIHTTLQLVFIVAVLMEPFTPSLSETIYSQLGLSRETRPIPDEFTFTDLQAGHKIGRPKPIIQALSTEQTEFFQKKFAGKGQEAPPFELDAKVGKIVEVKPHPNADRLYLLKVDVGQEVQKQICAGLVGKYGPDELQDSLVVVACNLKHSKMKGEVSEGMLLASESNEGTKLLSFSNKDKVKVGDQVTVKGGKFEPAKVVSRKLLQSILKNLSTDEQGNVVFEKKFPLSIQNTSGIVGIPDGKVK